MRGPVLALIGTASLAGCELLPCESLRAVVAIESAEQIRVTAELRGLTQDVVPCPDHATCVDNLRRVLDPDTDKDSAEVIPMAAWLADLGGESSVTLRRRGRHLDALLVYEGPAPDEDDLDVIWQDGGLLLLGLDEVDVRGGTSVTVVVDGEEEAGVKAGPGETLRITADGPSDRLPLGLALPGLDRVLAEAGFFTPGG